MPAGPGPFWLPASEWEPSWVEPPGGLVVQGCLPQFHRAEGICPDTGTGAIARHTYRDLTPASSLRGGADRDRTDDLLLAKQVLYQLSYRPKRKVSLAGLMLPMRLQESGECAEEHLLVQQVLRARNVRTMNSHRSIPSSPD